MAEILKRGSAKEPTYTLKCGCGSKVRFRRSEGSYVSDQRDGDALVFTCPVCKQEKWVAESLVR